MIWTDVLDVTSLMIYGLLAIFALWVVSSCVRIIVENRRDIRRWKHEDAQMQARLDAALRKMDDEQHGTRPPPPQ